MDEALFKKVPIKVQKKSGFDLSFQNLLTTKVGTITPVLCEELIPNETVHLKAAIEAQLPPLASDTFMRCDLKYEAFFVPTRIIFPNFEEWLMPNSNGNVSQEQYKPKVPLVTLDVNDVQRGSLADYLGFKSNLYSGATGYTGWSCDVNALPFLGYHKIYDDWYRNSLVQNPIYRNRDGLSNAAAAAYNANTSTLVTPCTNRTFTLSNSTGATTVAGSKKFMDDVLVTDLRQRNFGIDYFTSATPNAQNGDEQGLSMLVGASNTASFTIGQLRAANAIQQWLERNNLAGNRLQDYVRANYGANLSDGIAQRAVLLGSGQFSVYSKGIYQTANGEFDSNSNPFTDSVGAKFGSAAAAGSDTIIDSFTAMEPGYLYVMCTLVPKVTYATGVDRKLLRYVTNDRSDMANPLLQGTGNQPIWTTELISDVAQSGLRSSIFGFTERFAEWKSKNDELHGLLRENRDALDSGGTLGSFALQSSFIGSDSPQISTDFLKIPTDYLDNVSAVEGNISKYGCWIDTYFDFKVSMPLARYSMPTLQDPAYEHGDDIVIDRGGKRL